MKCFADSQEDTEGKWCKTDDKPATEEICLEEECKGLFINIIMYPYNKCNQAQRLFTGSIGLRS